MDGFNKRVSKWACWLMIEGRDRLRDRRGQGTTEYAILVGVLVVIAIIAVVAFRGKLQELWNAISEGVNSL
jgi:Flp pilus assembly pilin Flp